MKTLGKLIVIGLVIALIGFILKMALIEGGGILLVLSLSFLSILFFIQFVLSFIRITNNKKLRLISAWMSFTMSIAFMAILYRYQWWAGWSSNLLVSTVLFAVLSLALYINKEEVLTSETKKYVWKNLLLPWVFMFVFGGLHYVLSSEAFYNTFNYRRGEMSYQQFLDEVVNKPQVLQQ